MFQPGSSGLSTRYHSCLSSPTSEMASIAPEQPDLVWFSGTDHLRFLNDIISQELGDMEPGQAHRSFLLTPQGKLDFLLWAIREEERIGLVTDPGRGESLASA